jgi:CBS domain containing-hemolysin-like protein
MIEGVLRLPDRTVRSIMIPRGDVVWLDVADSRRTVWNAVRTSGHSRYPVCRGASSRPASWPSGLATRSPASWLRACGHH